MPLANRFGGSSSDRIHEKFGIIKGVPVIFMSAKYNLNLPTLMCPRQQFGPGRN